jgi:hypothetical protein
MRFFRNIKATTGDFFDYLVFVADLKISKNFGQIFRLMTVEINC